MLEVINTLHMYCVCAKAIPFWKILPICKHQSKFNFFKMSLIIWLKSNLSFSELKINRPNLDYTDLIIVHFYPILFQGH